jgi:hypothetical protein
LEGSRPVLVPWRISPPGPGRAKLRKNLKGAGQDKKRRRRRRESNCGLRGQEEGRKKDERYILWAIICGFRVDVLQAQRNSRSQGISPDGLLVLPQNFYGSFNRF